MSHPVQQGAPSSETFHYRPARPQDLSCAATLFEPDRALFSDPVWRTLPERLAELLERRRVRAAVVEDADGKICFCGVATFVRPEAMARLPLRQEGAAAGLRESLLEMEAAGKRVMLSGKSLAAANTSGDLSLVHLFGCGDTPDVSTSRGMQLQRMGFEAFAFQHGGYRIAELWQEAVQPLVVAYLRTMGVPEVFRRSLMVGGPAPAAESCWFRFTREDATERHGHPLSFLMKHPPPRLSFTAAQQRLLELALLEVSDRTAASQLHLSEAAIKKRWRSIYERVEQVESRIAPPSLSGSDRRRSLLGYLRQHLEELRPYLPQ